MKTALAFPSSVYWSSPEVLWKVFWSVSPSWTHPNASFSPSSLPSTASAPLSTAVLPQEARSLQIINRHRLLLVELNSFSSKNCCFQAYGCTGPLFGEGPAFSWPVSSLTANQDLHLRPGCPVLLGLGTPRLGVPGGGPCAVVPQAQPHSHRFHLAPFCKLCHRADVLREELPSFLTRSRKWGSLSEVFLHFHAPGEFIFSWDF